MRCQFSWLPGQSQLEVSLAEPAGEHNGHLLTKPANLTENEDIQRYFKLRLGHLNFNTLRRIQNLE